MKFYKWILVLIALVIAGLLVFSFFGGSPRPIKEEPIEEQTQRTSDMLEDMDLFSEQKKSTNDMIEGTVDY
ncbi:hypothetical protein [uncultured Dubosiella sp.]|uniref:hypothetical protein n=1 Tax=uncultured Dubosiella sp. TaxID=1937011 RepID=UPI00208926F1|nr:hypothetical protein [uncultured Dubosiella sp.]GJM56349.1 hypothetical protein EROP_00420 [Erysipelotrichaceae bacterium OPF54]